MAILKFNGVVMPSPKFNGFRIGKNKIWSQDTGRSNSGLMNGRIIAIKRKIEIQFPPLTTLEIEKIDSVVSNKDIPYVNVEYTDEKGTKTTINAYFNDPIYPIYGTNIRGRQLIVGCQIDAIER